MYDLWRKREAEKVLGPDMLRLLEAMTHNEVYLNSQTMDRLESLQSEPSKTWYYVNGKGIQIQLMRCTLGDIRDNDYSMNLTKSPEPRPSHFRKHLQKVLELRALMRYADLNGVKWEDFVLDAHFTADQISGENCV